MGFDFNFKYVRSQGREAFRNFFAPVRFMLRALPFLLTFGLGASLWLIPFFGVFTAGYVNVAPIIFLSAVALGGCMIGVKIAVDVLPDDFGIALFLGLIFSVIAYLGMAFISTFVASSNMMIAETNGQTTVTIADSDRLYPFWNDDFILVAGAKGTTTYSMDTRCDTGICETKATVAYQVNQAFVVQYAHSVTNYARIMQDALTVAIIRDEAATIAEVEAAVCSNSKAYFELAENAACPVTMKVTLSVTQK